MNILHSNSQIVLCVNPKGEIVHKRSIYPKETNSYEVTDLLELLRVNDCIGLHESKEVFLSIDLSNGKVDVNHSLKDENGNFDFQTMSHENSCVEKDFFLVHT